MNHTKLVSIIKTLVVEAHHGARYNYGRKKLAVASLHTPDRQLQVAEEGGKKKLKRITNKTMTGQTPNAIVRAEYDPHRVQHPEGSKPTIDTK